MSWEFFECLNDLDGKDLEKGTFISLNTDKFKKLMDCSDFIGIKKGFFGDELDFECVNYFQYDGTERIIYSSIDKDELNNLEYLLPCYDLPDDIEELLIYCKNIDKYLEENNITLDEFKINLKKIFEKNNFKEFNTNHIILEYVANTNFYDLIIESDLLDADVREIDEDLEEELNSMEEIGSIYYSCSEKYLYKTNKDNYWIYKSDRIENKCLDFLFGTYHKATTKELEEFGI